MFYSEFELWIILNDISRKNTERIKGCFKFNTPHSGRPKRQQKQTSRSQLNNGYLTARAQPHDWPPGSGTL